MAKDQTDAERKEKKDKKRKHSEENGVKKHKKDKTGQTSPDADGAGTAVSSLVNLPARATEGDEMDVDTKDGAELSQEAMLRKGLIVGCACAPLRILYWTRRR